MLLILIIDCAITVNNYYKKKFDLCYIACVSL